MACSYLGTAQRAKLHQGLVIPASPLALDEHRRLDERRQRALMRYYHAAGAGGVAVGVHTTQFEIRKPEIGLFEPVLALCAETLDACARAAGRPIIKIAGACGSTAQAVAEASLAVRLGYDAVLLSLSALKGQAEEAVLTHCRLVGEVMPLIGFYLQPAVGGIPLSYSFWRRFAEIENVAAIKIAPFNRYQTLDVVRAVADAGRENEIALYTGNDDNILMDLITPFTFKRASDSVTLRIRGGLLGQWAVWTHRAVHFLDCIHTVIETGASIRRDFLETHVALLDANAAIFDAANGFHGCIAGINEVLRRQGLLANNLCLNPAETLSVGQAGEISRVCAAYPQLTDDEFVRANLDSWMKD